MRNDAAFEGADISELAGESFALSEHFHRVIDLVKGAAWDRESAGASLLQKLKTPVKTGYADVIYLSGVIRELVPELHCVIFQYTIYRVSAWFHAQKALAPANLKYAIDDLEGKPPEDAAVRYLQRRLEFWIL